MLLDSVSEIGAVCVVSSAETSAVTEVAASDTVAVIVTVSHSQLSLERHQRYRWCSGVNGERPAVALGPSRLTVTVCTPSRKWQRIPCRYKFHRELGHSDIGENRTDREGSPLPDVPIAVTVTVSPAFTIGLSIVAVRMMTTSGSGSGSGGGVGSGTGTTVLLPPACCLESAAHQKVS